MFIKEELLYNLQVDWLLFEATSFGVGSMLLMPSDSSAVMLKFQESSNCLYYMAAIVESLFVKIQC